MAITAITPRDRLQRIVDLGRKTMRYWWLIGIFAVAGGALSLSFALARAKKFQSWSTIFYQERIQSSLLSPNREEAAQRNIGDKYREILLARAQLAQIVGDPKLTPYPDEPDTDLAIDQLRAAVKLEARGGNAFRIVYTDADPERAKAVTEKLTKLLQEKDEQLRNQQARETVEFATKQKEEADLKLKDAELALTAFLSKHPEFAADANTQQSEGAGIRALRANQTTPKQMTPEMQRLYALDRQRQRITARLEAPADAQPVRIIAPPTPERIAAEAAVTEAQRDVNSAKRELDDAQGKYGPKHPSVLKATDRLTAAEVRLRQAKAAVPPDVETTVAPATAEDRKKLQRDLADIDAQIARLQSAKPGTGGTGSGSAVPGDTTNWIVQLETEHTDLRRQVNEQRERSRSLADAVFRSTIDANQKLAETGGRLAVVDPAFKPVKPSGPGKKIFLMAGMVLFLGMGFAIAVLLAVIDDRLYRRTDLDQLGIAVLAVIPPGAKEPRSSKRARRAATTGAAPLAEKDAA